MTHISSVLTYDEIIIRLLCALAVGFIIGFERERKHHVAGTRTHMLVSLSACIAMITNEAIFTAYDLGTDPGRFGAAVISGMGFIGAGTIVHDKFSAKGLTTAAGVWAVACLGLASGAGLWPLALVGAGLTFIVLSVIYKVQKNIFGMRSNYVTLSAQCENIVDAVGFLNELFEKNKIVISNMKIDGDGDVRTIQVSFLFGGIHQKRSMKEIITSLSENDDIKEVSVDYGSEV